jgi:transmembrane sensor
VNVEANAIKEYTPEQLQQAAEWFLLIHDAEEPSIELLQEWTRWLNESEGHRKAFEHAEQAYHLVTPSLAAPAMPVRSLEGGGTEEDYDGRVSVAEWLAQRTEGRKQGAARPHLFRVIPSRWLRPLAASVAVLGAALVLWSSDRTDPTVTVPTAGTIETRTGEHKELILPDGSHVTLGARSRLSTEFEEGARIVRLQQGEAYFAVQKDPDRPFVVRAFSGVITAVGTAFNVRATEDRVTIAVTEGAVRIAQEQQEKPADNLHLSLGQQVSFSAKPSARDLPTSAITRFDVDEPVRWRAGWLVYRNEPLRYVIADVARYTDLQLELSDSVSDDLRFSGAVFKDDVGEWITALPRIFPVAIEADGRRMIISSRSPAVIASGEATARP